MPESWDTRLYGWLQSRSAEPTKYFQWFYGDEVTETVGKVFVHKNFPDDDENMLESKRLKWASVLRTFQKYGRYSIGNEVTILEGGDACFPQMLAHIGAANSRVWCESYIFDCSPVANLFVQAFLRAAQRGCDVILLVDYIGGFTLPKEWVHEMRCAGIEVIFFNPVLPSSACTGPASFRDHRKILICDDTGFTGGMNIHKETGGSQLGTGEFYDVHAMLRGPCVADLADVLRDSLLESGSRVARDPIPSPKRIDHGVYVQILESNVRQRRRTLQNVIQGAIDAADCTVCLTTAYFFPPGFLRRALTRAPSRGASLSLLLSGGSDFYPLPGDLLAQSHFLRRFFRETIDFNNQVAVHLYGKRHMHAKHMVIDGVFSTIGSFNFDLYSARRNLEVGVSVFDRGVALQLQAMHQKITLDSRKTTLDDSMYHQPVVRMACAVSYWFIRLSGRNFFDGLDCFERKWLVRKAALTFLLEEQAAQFVAMSMMWGLE